MDAVLLAGGFGTRLRPLTYTRPKPLLPVAGRPMLEWALDRLPKEVERVIVAVNWRAEDLEAHFARRREAQNGPEFIVVRENEPLGTAGAVKNCAGHLGGGPFFVLNGDIVSDMDLDAMVAQHRTSGGVGTIALHEVPPEEVPNYGVASFAEGDRIQDFVEKPPTAEAAPSRWINAGAYLLEPEVLDLIEPGRMMSMEKEVFPHLLPRGLHGFRHEGTWVDVGDPQRLRAASAAMDQATTAGPGAEIALDAVFEHSIAGQDVAIGSGARVERSVLGDGVEVAPGSTLLNCVVGDGEQVTGQHEDERIWSRPVPEGYPKKQVGNALAR